MTIRRLIVVLAAVALLGGCTLWVNESDIGAPGQTGSLSAGALDAASYRQPTFLTDLIEGDTALGRIGDLLVGDTGLRGSYVDGNQWCTLRSGNCVAVGGGDVLEFDGVAVDEFELDAVAEVTPGVDLEVVAVRALHHPVDDTLMLSIDLRSDTVPWSDSFDIEPELRIDGIEREVLFLGPLDLVAGITHRYTMVSIDNPPLDGPAELTVVFDDGEFDPVRTAELTVTVDDVGPAIDRSSVPIDASPPVEVYRSATERSTGSDGDALAELIAMLASDRAGGDVLDLIASDSPAAIAITAIAGLGAEVEIRSDADDPSAICWQIRPRGTFCERWREPVTDDNGAIVSWEIEGTDLGDLVAARVGSLPGSRVAMLSLPVGRIVVGSATVRNDAATELPIALYQPTVIVDDIAIEPLVSDGEIFVEPGETEPAWFVTPIDDLDIDLLYRVGYDLTAEPLIFAADASAPTGGTGADPDGDTGAEAELSASIRLVSLLAEEQYDAAVQMAAPGTDAEAYLSDMAVMTTDAFLFPTVAESNSTRLCLQGGLTEACNDLLVDGLDADGLITSLAVSGTPAGDLMRSDRTGGDDQFQLDVERAMHWPGGLTTVSWTLTNLTESDVFLDGVATIDADLAQTPAERNSSDELPGGRNVSDISSFPSNVLDQAIEVRGEGRRAVRTFSAVTFIGEPFGGIESTTEFEASTTDFETRGGRTLTIPGAWGTYVIYDEETSQLTGVDLPLGAPKSLKRGDLVLMTFSPPFSPLDSSPEELIAALSEFTELDSVEYAPAVTVDGRTTALVNGELQWFDESALYFATPGDDEFFVLVAPIAGDNGLDGLADTLTALLDITQVSES